LKIILTSLLISFFVLSFYSCKKRSDALSADFVIPKNQAYTFTKDNGVKVTVSDIFSRVSSFKRKVNVNPGISKGKIEPIYISFISNSSENIYSQMKSHPNSVNGVLILETGGLLVLKKHIVNGAWGKTEIIASRLPGPIYNPNLACNAITIHDCVSYEIEDMNWIEYGACLVSAPACYATLWASCTWEVCHNHMQYTNPIQ
jgi:hypothetical protein